MTDDFDHLIRDAFDEFAAAERGTGQQAPGTAAVRRTVAVRRRNRYATLCLLGAVLIAIPVAAYAGNPRGDNSPPLPGTSETSPASPTPSASTATPTEPIPGMYLYRLHKADGTNADDLLHWAPGGDWQKVTAVKEPTGSVPGGPPLIDMSPDHQHIAWVLGGKLQVSALDGSQVRTVVADTGTLSCERVSWAADSRHLLFHTLSHTALGGTLESVDIDGTGRRVLGTSPGASDCRPRSADGTTAYEMTFVGTKHEVVVFDGGAAPRPVKAAWPAGREPYIVVAIAPGSGRLLVSTVRIPESCHCSPPQRYSILDTATGQVTDLDHANDPAESAPMSGAFTVDGRVVLLADRNQGNGNTVDLFLTVFSADGAILGNVPLPDMRTGLVVGFDA